MKARNLSTGKIITGSAESLFYENGAYDYTTPGRTADDLWKQTEGPLCSEADVLEQLAREALTAGHLADDEAKRQSLRRSAKHVVRYAAEMTARHEGFDAQLASQGLSVDEIQAWRERDVRARRDAWDKREPEFTVLVRPTADGHRLVLSSWGWVHVTDGARGMLIPIGPYGAVLVDDRPRKSTGISFGALTDEVVEEVRRSMQHATCPPGLPGPKFVAGHPDDPLFC